MNSDVYSEMRTLNSDVYAEMCTINSEMYPECTLIQLTLAGQRQVSLSCFQACSASEWARIDSNRCFCYTVRL